MKIVEVNTYTFDELSDTAKEKAVERLADINVDYEWWDFTYEDAKNIGLKITEFDIDRGNYCKGDIITSAPEVIKDILKNHGKDCETYKTAKRYEQTFKDLNEEEFANAEHELLHDLLEDYLVILRHEYEYQTSEEAIIETIKANEYMFTEDGKLWR